MSLAEALHSNLWHPESSLYPPELTVLSQPLSHGPGQGSERPVRFVRVENEIIGQELRGCSVFVVHREVPWSPSVPTFLFLGSGSWQDNRHRLALIYLSWYHFKDSHTAHSGSCQGPEGPRMNFWSYLLGNKMYRELIISELPGQDRNKEFHNYNGFSHKSLLGRMTLGLTCLSYTFQK